MKKNVYIPRKKVILATPCSWKFGKPCLASKASRGFFLLLPTMCQKRGLAKEPSILRALENIQERKGKRHSLPDTFFFLVFILAQHFVRTWQKHKSPQSTLTSALFSARIAKPQVQLLTGILCAAQLAYMSALNHVELFPGTNAPFPSEPGHRSTLTGRVTLQLTLQDWMAPLWIHQTICSLIRESRRWTVGTLRTNTNT